MKQAQYQKMLQLGFDNISLFKSVFDLLNKLVKRESTANWDISAEIKSIEQNYQSLLDKSATVDVSLKDHVIALQIKSAKRLIELEKKIMRAERNKLEASERQLTAIKNELFPNNSLQERVYNFSDLYARMGKDLLALIYQASPALEMQFSIIVVK